jgi:hypothetical protein
MTKVGKGLLISQGNNLNFRRWPGELGQNVTSQEVHLRQEATSLMPQDQDHNGTNQGLVLPWVCLSPNE